MSKSNKWTEDSAETFVFRNSDIIKTKFGALIVKNTSAGNGVLGALDYLRNYKKAVVSMVTEEEFEERKDVHKQRDS